MSFGSFDSNSRSTPMVEINTTPLVDVMLVLLIIFMITAPLLTHSVKIDLPQATSEPNLEKPDTITIAIDGHGRFYWNDKPVTESVWRERLLDIAARNPQPELHLRADKSTRYEKLAQVMAAAQNAGIERMGFITQPETKRP